ncbi:sodium/proton antiporter (NhaA family) [Solirubrobacter pauli]|uniref:Na(+)/H(+) antiporter NhaA n=1 Tax=Solirubrobacter pauli TaxID=166793 RepID=A0A660L9J1_9ACTN|nr:Na+/H+ antiporter NhaA [Solirubrobacter pauli]RKQ91747.1 sodium/proton antiporter (NhaA family) [Solirubrobacter pauli]
MTDRIREFLHDEAAGGLAILAATVVALLWANVGPGYDGFWHTELGPLDLHHWVNDALMALFFLVVGLEIKREFVDGRLQSPRAAALPAIAAVGGVLAPIVIFVVLIAGGEGAEGWAIACATDIAFAVGLIAVLGDRVSEGTRVFLLAVAIVDHIIAIAIIAIFYAEAVSVLWLLAAAVLAVAVKRLPRLWIPLGIALWIAVHEAGVHATIAGVTVGLLLPVALGERVEHRLHPWSAFLVVPLFALANAGVDFGGGVLGDALGSRLTWAIVAGLVIGKLLGISGATLGALRAGGTLPEGMPRPQLAGVAAAAGIGFTVSLFIAELAYDDPALVERAKVGIFAGSVISGILGVLLLSVASRARRV